MSDLLSALQQGVEKLGIALPPGAPAQLIQFIELLNRWNRVYNLTAIRSLHEMVGKHLLDSLAIMPYVSPANMCLLDVGSGAGLPGIPLALALPGITVTLLDSNSKKTRFMQQAVIELGLSNVKVVHARAEEFTVKEGFTIITSRAFADLSSMIAVTRHLLAADGTWLAMKGEYPAAEIAALPEDVVLTMVKAVNVPQVVGQRHVLCLARKALSTGDCS